MTIEDAKEVLGTDIQSDGSLKGLGAYIKWDPGYDNLIDLDGTFSVLDLEAITTYIKWFNESKQVDKDGP